MADTEQKKVRSIFLAAIEEHPPERWAEYLGEACRGEPELRQQVEFLLAGHEQANDLLDDPHAAPVAPSAPSIGEGPGTVIGSYKLLEQIGEGGFGVVFMAEQQQPVRRKVALKIVKPGMDTRQVVARFEAERQALALMDHPNIAQIFDAGATESGRPYFVMELVRGIPITDFCKQQHLGVRERLELFTHVCQALQHAHQKGIIHRDLKPSNVMVTQHDVTPVVKIIDFGIAKAAGQQLTDKTLFTNFAQMIGTPMYMSPEQAQMSGLDVDTRSDVYSLGVLLYELMTGQTPFDKERLRTVAYDEMIRIIREEEPLRPSTRISTSGDAAPTAPIERNTTSQKLSQLLRGELDWIVMKALDKDRNRRYDSASALADDVQRFLNGEMVKACPPTVAYQLQKTIRRHKRTVMAAAVMAMLLVGGIIGTTWGLIRANRARADAVGEAQQKQTALEARDAALEDAKDKLYHTLLQQARAERLSGQIGQRFAALKAIREAGQIRVTPELRTEAIAALALPDLEIAQEWEAAAESATAFSVDATLTRYARLGREGGVTICRLAAGREEVIARLPAYGESGQHFMRLSPDGRFLAYGHSGKFEGVSGGLRVWKLDGPSPTIHFDDSTSFQHATVDFHVNGRRLAIGHTNASVSVFDLTDGKRLRRINVGANPSHLAFHPSDDRLAVSTADTIAIHDTATGNELSHWSHAAHTIAWHPDGRRLATGGNDRKVHLWNVATATETMTGLEHGEDGLVVAFNHSGDCLLARGWGMRLLMWNSTTGQQLLNTWADCGMQIGPDDRTIGYGRNGNKLTVWRMADCQGLRVLGDQNFAEGEQFQNAYVDAGGRMVATASPRFFHLFDLANSRELARATLPRPHAAYPIGFAGGAGWITGGTAGVLLWPTKAESITPDEICIGPPQNLGAQGNLEFSDKAEISADGNIVAVPDSEFVTVIHRDHPERKVRLGPQYDLRFCAISPDNRWAVTASHWTDGKSKSVKIWDINTGQQVQELPVEGSIRPHFSPDGRWLATSSAENTQFWHVGDWTPDRNLVGSVHYVFSPDGRLSATANTFGTVCLTEFGTGREVAKLNGPVQLAPIRFSPDGTKLVMTSAGFKWLYVWDLRLIRQQLKDLGLDWDWPEFPVASSMAAPIQKVDLKLGDVAANFPTREQQARQAIERYRREVEATPDSATACNSLAWQYLTAPEELRDVSAALPLAEKAVKLESNNAIYRNTLGVAYYRNGKYREAVETLRVNLEKQVDWGLPFDLYFLAMSYKQLGESERARDYYDWAVRWTHSQRDLSEEHLAELTTIRTEADKVLKQEPIDHSTPK